MRRVLFVDDDTNVLQGLRRMLRGLRHEWEMEFVPGGREALEAAEREPFDIVVSDMKMRGMDGAELLDEIKRRYPDTIRIILSGHSEQEAILKSVGPTHQYLAKPCDPDQLKGVIGRAYRLRSLLASTHLKRLVADLDSLPSLPSLYQEVVAELQKPNASLQAVAGVIEKDVGMSAKVLKLVNSAYFGLLREVTTVGRAVTFLGLETINALVLSAHIFEEFKGGALPGFSLERLWDHSLLSAAVARKIAAQEDLPRQLADEAYTAAMLHDVGKLVLAANQPEGYAKVLRRAADGEGASAAEREVFGATHAEVGAYLIGLWGLPDSTVEAIAFHAEPRQGAGTGVSVTTLVHCGSCLARELQAEESGAGERVDEDYLGSLGLAARLPAWREACRELATHETEA